MNFNLSLFNKILNLLYALDSFEVEKRIIMKLFQATCILLSFSAVNGFSAIPRGSSRSSSTLKSTVDADVPERVAPDAGWLPDWEGRTGLSPEEFMKSDMAKPDRSEMWECPLTRWDSKGYVRPAVLYLIHCPLRILSGRENDETSFVL